MMEREPFILAELEDLSSVFAPLKSTTRIKYTCFNVSPNLLVMGASSGGLYVFRREPCVFLQLIPSKDGAVSQIAISSDERMLGIATARGTVSLVERNQRSARVVASSFEHSGNLVTALTWGGNELFIGDATGRVSVLARTVFQPPAALLMQLDSRIVQLDSRDGLLVVSTLSRCFVCHTERELYKQVGQKLRDGQFGGCFLSCNASEESEEPKSSERARGVFSDMERFGLAKMSDGKASPEYSNLAHLRLFCSRPGLRVWEGDAEGTVLKTHNFKEALMTPPRPITTEHSFDNNNHHTPNNNLVVSFGRLFAIAPRYLLTYSPHAVYVLDPDRSDVVVWCNQVQDIADVRVTENVIYVWCTTGKMHALNLVPLEKFLIRLYFWKKYKLAAELCFEFADYLRSHASHLTKLHLLKDLDEKLKEQDEFCPETVKALEPLLEVLRSNAQHAQFQNSKKLQSGIYQITRPSYLNLKFRSHSVSPDRLNKPEHGGSTSSLPELVAEEEEVAPEETAVEADRHLVDAVLELCPRVSSSLAKPEEVRELVQRVLRLCDPEDPLTAARQLPLRKMFSENHVSTISKAFRTALTSRSLLALVKNLPIPTTTPTLPQIEESNANKLPKPQYLKNDNCEPSSSLTQRRPAHLTHEKILAHPKHLVETVEGGLLEMDLRMSRVVRVFGDVLEEDSVLSDVKAALPHCYFLCLLELIRKFETVGIALDESLSPPRALGVVNFLLKVGQVDQICRWSHTLDINDVTYLVMKRESEEGRTARIAFLSLMDGWLSANYKECLLRHEQYLIYCLQAVHGGDSEACQCGFPLPENNKKDCPRFYNLASQLLDMKEEPAEEMRMCGRLPWLWPHLLKMRAADPLLNLLPLILHLGDLEELERRLPEMDSLLSEVLVRHLTGLHKGDCLNCGRRRLGSCTAGISWTQAALLLIKAVGHTETLKLFTQYKADVNGLEPVFHRAVVLAAIMEKHSTGLRHSVVDIFSGRSSQQTSLLSPTLQAELLPRSPVTPGPSHWGLKLDPRAPCPICSLRLSAKVLTDAGVVAFPCRHAFHAVCLRTRNACPVCCVNEKSTT